MYQYIQRPKHERVFARYRPQRSCDKVIFSQASVILSTEGEVSAPVHAGIHTPSLGRHTPRADIPPGGHCCVWYASYWNAFLLQTTLGITEHDLNSSNPIGGIIRLLKRTSLEVLKIPMKPAEIFHMGILLWMD